MKYRAFHLVVHTRRVAVLFAPGLALLLALAISMNAGAQTPTATASVAKVEDQPGFSVIGVSVRTDSRKEARHWPDTESVDARHAGRYLRQHSESCR